MKGHLSRRDYVVNPFSTNPTKWSNTLRQFVSNCLSVFDHFVGLGLQVFKTYLVLTKTTSLCGSHKNDHHKCFTFLENHLLGIFLEETLLKKFKKMEASAMEFFSQLVCFSKFYIDTDLFSKILRKHHLFGILLDKSENLIIWG